MEVFEIDPKIFVFKFANWIQLNKVFEERPWSISGNLMVLHDYFDGLVHQDLDWDHQVFWIQLKHLLPEFMNAKVVKEMGAIMGEVIALQPENGCPVAGEIQKVCVNINLKTPLRRGILAVTATGHTRWVRFYYEKQPHNLCLECYVLDHSKKDCKKRAEDLVGIHALPVTLENVKNPTVTRTRRNMQAPRIAARRGTRDTPFVPPKDGVLVIEAGKEGGSNIESEMSESSELGSGARLGKRQRNSRTQSIPKTDSSNNSTMTTTTTTTTTLVKSQVSAVDVNSASISGEEQVPSNTKTLYKIIFYFTPKLSFFY